MKVINAVISGFLAMITMGEAQAFDKIFDLDLKVQSDQKKSIGDKNLPGAKYIASGDGTIKGKNIEGKVLWDFYEVQGSEHCQSDLFGKVITKDGHEFTFHARGALQVDEQKSKIWHNTSSMIFDNLPKEYAHLKGMNAILKGIHNLNNYTMSHQIFN